MKPLNIERLSTEKDLHRAYLRSIEEAASQIESALKRTFINVHTKDMVALATLAKSATYARAYVGLSRLGHCEESVCLARVVIEAWANFRWTIEHPDKDELRLVLLGHRQEAKKRERLQYYAEMMKGDTPEPVREYLRKTRDLPVKSEEIRKRYAVGPKEYKDLQRMRPVDRFTEIGAADVYNRYYTIACSAIHSDADSLQDFMHGDPDGTSFRFAAPREVLFQSIFDDIILALLVDTALRVQKAVQDRHRFPPEFEGTMDQFGQRRDALLARTVEVNRL